MEDNQNIGRGDQRPVKVPADLGIDDPSPLDMALIALMEACGPMLGPGGAKAISAMTTDGALKRWNLEPDTIRTDFISTLENLIDGQAAPTDDAKAAEWVASFCQSLHACFQLFKAPGGPLAGQGWDELCVFVRKAGDQRRLIGVLKETPGVNHRFLSGLMALIAAAQPADITLSPELHLRSRVERLKVAAQSCWRSLLLGYTALAQRPGQPEKRPAKRKMLGAIHKLYADNPSLPRVLVNEDLLRIRNAEAHPELLTIDVATETASFAADEGGPAMLGPLTDDLLRQKADTALSNIFSAAAAFVFVLLEPSFAQLERQGWKLLPGQKLLENRK